MNALSVAEQAKIMGKSERWVRYLCEAGKLRAIKIGKKTWMIIDEESNNVYTKTAETDD
jgi:hypothetical protein